ncbi:uncharacterized protein [Pocillopora verrucosa]|uniref:uncharacterized protein n=1 Tax=Pocillopora verrucosa TaxID=203993 RepID=UPI0033417B2E
MVLREEINGIYDEIRQTCSLFRYMCILRTITMLRNKLQLEVTNTHTRKISRLLYRETDVDEHILNISSYELSFFQKLVLCRGLKFAIPQRVSPVEIKASFEKVYWNLERHLPNENSRELAAATLRSVALEYINKSSPKPPKALLQAIEDLKKRDDIVVTKPDKGSGVVVMDKSEYLRLLSEASINDTSKFRFVDSERPRTRGRPPKYYHPLLQKERELETLIRKILPKSIADALRPKGSRLAHLYGLPKTHKEQLAVRPILSATNTYNYSLAKWLDDKLKPLSCNQYTMTDTFRFADEVRGFEIKNGKILVSYDVTSLFTNVPLEETIQILAEKAFAQDWFNETHSLNISKADLIDLLRAATKNQLFQFDGALYEQTDGVAMGSPLGPLLANVFMCSVEENLEQHSQLPRYYRRYVDDTLTVMPDRVTAGQFLDTLNSTHPSLQFTMEVEREGSLPFLGTELLNRAPKIESKVYIKRTNTGLLLHFQSHVDIKYKRSLVNTMVDRAYRLSSNWSFFSEECDRLRGVFHNLKYPKPLVETTIKRFVERRISSAEPCPSPDVPSEIVRLVLPFKDQSSANHVKQQLNSLSSKLSVTVQLVFVSPKLDQQLKQHEIKPPIVNQQCIVYEFKCNLCDAGYVGYTRGHLHERVEGHTRKSSSIYKHYHLQHNSEMPERLIEQFNVIAKCNGKFDCLVNEMLYIRMRKPILNVQTDSIRAKVFV